MYCASQMMQLKQQNYWGLPKQLLIGHSIRGRHDKAGTIFVMPFEKEREWDFGSIGITRVPEFGKRLSLIKAKSESYTGDTTIKERGDVKYAHLITLRHGKSKVEFKCGDPTLIKAPKGLADDQHFAFILGKGDIAFMKASASAMGAEHLVFSSSGDNHDELEISIPSKEKGEAASIIVDSPVMALTDTKEFSFKYDVKILLEAVKGVEKLLRRDELEEVEVIVTRRGVFHIVANGMLAYILPSP